MKLPPRLKRLRMKAQHLDFVMIHITGNSNMTHYLSVNKLEMIANYKHSSKQSEQATGKAQALT